MWWIWFCHFMPLQVACHFEWRMPLQVACYFEWRVPLQVACHSEWRMPLQLACHFKWRVALWACHFMPLQVACRTVSMPLHATSSGGCHFKWRMPLQVACRTVSMPLHATSSGACHFKWRVAPWACHFMPLQVAWSGEIGLRTSCVLNENLRNNLHLVVEFPS